jgi:hypothetical protein
VKAAAVMCSFGIDGMRWLDSRDPTEMLVMQVVADEAHRIAQQRNKALAAEIANAVSRLFR